VTSSGATLEERDSIARDAIDMAIERGGDQAVDKSNNDVICYGGRTKAIYKRTSVKSRSFASQLTGLMARADNVLIMGHRFGDFDSFGASIGIARLAMLCGIKVNIAVDMRDKNLAPCVEVMQRNEVYSRVFVDNAEGLDLINSDTLVVLVDHGTLSRSQFADISKKAQRVAVIDHHRKSEELPDSVVIDYIAPYASSTCELVTEMLESSINSQCLLKDEADMLLSGILLDTKQFTRNTGTRTFSAAQYLRSAGANPTDVYNLFKTAPEDLAKEARFHTDITMYRENIAIASCDGETDETYRIIASKAADKMLTLRGVDAAFALVRINDSIHISGRSNGTINVQLILEKLNGGGHFEVAGAQVSGSSAEEVLLLLKSSIDSYCDEAKDEAAGEKLK
jgi:c-di-AMP phosphodiesterase-like protein